MSSAQSTSLTLLERVRAHDQDAWGRLLSLYSPLVISWCVSQGVRHQDAEDVTQEVFQAVAGSLPQFRKDRPTDTFRGWLRGITRNKLLDHFRKRQAEPQAQGGTDVQRRFQEVPQPDIQLPEDSPQEMAALYRRALEVVRSEFEAKTWQAFWRTAVDGQSPADVASELGMSGAAVRQSKSRILRRLREEVGDLTE